MSAANFNTEMKVGIGSASSYKAIVIAKFIKNNYGGVKIIAFDNKKIIGSIHSRYYDHVIVENEINDPNKYFDLVIKSKVDVMIPVDSSEYKLIYSNPKLQGLSQLSYLGSKESFLALNNKINLHKLAKDLHIKLPNSYCNDIKQIKPNTVVKPTDLSSSKGVLYVTPKTILSAKRKAAQYNTFIVQEYIKGKGVGISVFAKHGTILSHYGHERLAEYPISGGSSTYRAYYRNSQMLNVAKKIIDATNWSGFAMFEFKETSDKKLYLIEVNPRVWGSINQGLQNGVNYFESLLGWVLPKKKNKQINTYLSPILYLSFFKYIFHFNFRPLFLFVKNWNKNKADVSLFSDPTGFLSMLIRSL